MADKYATRPQITARMISQDAWIKVNLTPLAPAATAKKSVEDTTFWRKGIVLAGWKPRFAGSRGGTFASVQVVGEELDIVDDVHFIVTRGFKDESFFPLTDLRVLGQTSALHFFAHYLTGQTVHDGRGYSLDDILIAWMNVFQSLVFQLTKPHPQRVVTQIFSVLRIVARGIEELKDVDPTSQAMLSALRDDEAAQDMLQRSCSGVLGGRPMSQLERLRMTEVALKRTLKHHALLHADVDAVLGIFALLSVVPVVIGVLRGVVPVEKAADHICQRRATLLRRFEDSKSATLEGHLHLGPAPHGALEDGEWHVVCKDKRRKKANEGLLRDAVLLDSMARDGGIPANVDAWADLILYCQRTNAAGLRVTLGKPADLEAIGFTLHHASSHS